MERGICFWLFCQRLTLTCVVLVGRATFILALNQCQYLSRTDMSIQDLQILGAEAVFAPQKLFDRIFVHFLFIPTYCPTSSTAVCPQ